MKTKSVQDGVLFYLNENNYIVDVKIDAGIRSVVITDNVSMLESQKSFPDVEQLVISDNIEKYTYGTSYFQILKMLTHIVVSLNRGNTLLDILMQWIWNCLMYSSRMKMKKLI